VLSLAGLDGTWTTACLVNPASSIMVVWQINNGAAASRGLTFSDTTCTTIAMEETVNLSLSLGSAVVLDGGVAGITSATELNTTITSGIDTGLRGYDLVAIQGNLLFLGDINGFNDGSNPGLRPTQLDGVFPLIRLQ
jgi:hypothetical protein